MTGGDALALADEANATDSVTLTFGDPATGIFGVVRLGVLRAEAGAAPTGSALAVLFRRAEPAAVYARGGIELDESPAWSSFTAGEVSHTVRSPTSSVFAWEGAEAGFDLTVEATSAPMVVEPTDPVVAAGALEGYGQLVRVTGTVRLAGETVAVDALGQRERAHGVVEWDGATPLGLMRTVSAWFAGDAPEAGEGVLLQAIRPANAAGHDAETIWARVVRAGEPVPVSDPRLSTAADGAGHPTRVGLELWLDDDSPPLRAAAEVIGGTSLQLGALALDVAFLRWHAEGRLGVGRYDVLRRAD